MELTEEQKRMMDEKRKAAQQRLAASSSAMPSTSAGHSFSNPLLPLKVVSGMSTFIPQTITPDTKTFNSNSIFSSKERSPRKERKERLPRSPRKERIARSPRKERNVRSPRKRARDGDINPNQNSKKQKGAHIKAMCALISRQRFEVKVPFHRGIIEVFKSMKTQCYDTSKKTWHFDLSEHNLLVHRLRSLDDIQCESLPSIVQKVFSEQMRGGQPSKCSTTHDLSNVSPKLVNALMMFQRDGVNFGLSKQGRVLIADDMGLGKTLQAICIAAFYRCEWPLLVVAPSSVRFAWRDQLVRWLDGELAKEDVAVITTQKNFSVGQSAVVIISYDLLTRLAEEILKLKFQIVICDESHFIKNMKTGRTKAALPILKKCRRAILLSGTPALSRPSELFSQLCAVDNSLFPSFHQFGVRYCNATELPWGWDYSGCSNMTELQLIMEEKMMIRRTKSEVLTQLPSKRRQMIILDPEALKKKSLDKHAKTMLQADLKGSERRSALFTYFCETGIAKINAVKDYVADLLESGRKFILFAHHSAVLNALEKMAIDKKINYIRIDGSTESQKRTILCENFQLDESVQIALLSITAANLGINLTAASLVVFAELFWNPGILVQAEDRAYRIGQKDSVSIQYLVAEGTADDYIWPLVQLKLEVLSKAGLNKESFREADTTRLKTKDSSQTTLLDFFETDFLDESMETINIDEGNESGTNGIEKNHADTKQETTEDDFNWLLDDSDEGWCGAHPSSSQ